MILLVPCIQKVRLNGLITFFQAKLALTVYKCQAKTLEYSVSKIRARPHCRCSLRRTRGIRFEPTPPWRSLPHKPLFFSFGAVGFSTLWTFGRRVEFYMVPYKWQLESWLNLVALEPQTGHLTFLSILFSGRLIRRLKSGMN